MAAIPTHLLDAAIEASEAIYRFEPPAHFAAHRERSEHSRREDALAAKRDRAWADLVALAGSIEAANAAMAAHRKGYELAKQIRNSAAWLAMRHAQSPEVRAAGGAEAKDADDFHDETLAAELREVGLAADADQVAALRAALREALAELERERAEDAEESPAAALGRKGGQAKSAAKTAAAKENAKRAGRPNSWPGSEDGERWMRVLIESGSCAGSEAWQLTRDGELAGLFDDDGERLEVGNATWKGRRSAAAPGWL